MGVLTFTPSVPPGMRILPSTPSSTASTSIVALSVSISASTSPDFTWSPTFFIHLDSLPCSIVGDRAGMRTFTAIVDPSSERDIRPQFRRIRLGIIGREFGCFSDDRTHLRVDRFQLVFRRAVVAQQARAHLLDRIVLLAHFLHFFFGAVLRGIRHRMTA